MADLVRTQQALTAEDYRNFEQLFDREIPPSVRAHYMSFNGGSLAEEDVEAGRWGLPVHGFNPIKYGALPIEQLIEDLAAIKPEDDKFGSWARRSYVPFAYDAGGNPLFISLRDSDYGYVYIYTRQMAATSHAWLRRSTNSSRGCIRRKTLDQLGPGGEACRVRGYTDVRLIAQSPEAPYLAGSGESRWGQEGWRETKYWRQRLNLTRETAIGESWWMSDPGACQ